MEGIWWSPLVHSCRHTSDGIAFEESVLKVLREIVAERLSTHFEVNNVWKAKQSSQWCVYVKRFLRILQQLKILDALSNISNLQHTDADEWEKVQLEVKQQATVGIFSMACTVVTCFHRAFDCQVPSCTAVGTQCLAERRDNGLWAISVQECNTPVIEIHDSRLQRMWVAFGQRRSLSPLNQEFFEAVYACLLRYQSTMHCSSGFYGHHFRIPSGRLPSLSQAIAANRDGSRVFSNWIDCFSSPMTMLEVACDAESSRNPLGIPLHSFVRYCSPYADTDSCFGSLGSFFDVDFQTITSKGDILFFHPPNDNFILDRVSKWFTEMFVHQQNLFAGVYALPFTKSLLKMMEAFQSVSVWHTVSAPAFCSGHSRDDVAVFRASDCDYRVGSITRVSDLQVLLLPVSSLIMPIFSRFVVSCITGCHEAISDVFTCIFQFFSIVLGPAPNHSQK